MITALAGGVGAARFLEGLIRVIPQEEVTVIVNTGDDIELHGLCISPDIDTIIYTLTGIVDEEKGWGIRGDTFHCLEALERLGEETWFRLGDRDLATHIYRTCLLRSGFSLSEATQGICSLFGLNAKILPATDDSVVTKISTEEGVVHFQEYLVKRSAQDRVLNVLWEGLEAAEPADGVVDAILGSDGVILCPSNPIVSIGTILAIRGIREALREARVRVVAVSPIVGGSPIKGPADKLMSGLGIEVSAFGVANLYRDFLDVFIMDNVDQGLKDRVEELSIEVILTNTVMKDMRDKVKLAEEVLQAIDGK
jgi:LPPG:FO 2-phospho-L-lactate transferase